MERITWNSTSAVCSANTNYEVTVWNYDQNVSATGNYMAWGVVAPTNNPNYQPVVGGGGLTPKLARVPMTGPWPSNLPGDGSDTNLQLYAYAGTFYVTADGSGNASIYGWNDSDTYGSQQASLVDGFALGIATNEVFAPTTNTATALINPVAATYGPPPVWPYWAGIAMPTFTDNINTDESGNQLMGETFMPTRPFPLKDFYIACQGTTNSGTYIMALYDLGTGTTANYGNSFNPSTFANLLSHTNLSVAQYWSFSPQNLTNKTIVEFKFGTADQVLLTNGHSYFLGFQYTGFGSNDMIWERTTGGASYANGAAFKGSTTSVSNNTFAASVRNFLMAVGVLNPNIAISVTNYPLTGSWPTVATASPNMPLLDTYDDPTAPDQYAPSVPMSVDVGAVLSMSFIATNDFNLGAIGLRQRGEGSSNVLFTLAVYDVTNTFFSQGTNGSINKWPFNYQPNIDMSPLAIPVFGTNVDFYYTSDNGANGAGQGTNDQLLVLTIANPAYQVLLHSNHNYVVELSTDPIGQNANNVGLFQWVRDTGGTFQQELFPDLGDGNQTEGWRTNAVSTNTAYYILPRALSRATTDPELLAGNVVSGMNSVRDFVMAIYAAPPPAVPTSIAFTGVSRSGNNVMLTWSANPPGSYAYTVLRKINLTDASWTTLASGLSSPSYTDSTASATTGFYKISSP